MKRAIFILTAMFAVLSLQAQNTAGIKIAFYNAENMFDTIRNPHIDDADFTPGGLYRWNTDKYFSKINNIAKVIDDIGADVVGLAEIENEAVLRDLLYALKTDYNYIYRSTSDMRGIGQALLYRGSRFFPKRTTQIRGSGLTRAPLMVEGSLEGMETVFIVCHMPSKLSKTRTRSEASKSLGTSVHNFTALNPGKTVILMGDMNASPTEKEVKYIAESGKLFNPFEEPARKGYGTYSYRDKRYLYDQIMVSRKFDPAQVTAGIFVRDYMMSDGSRSGYPDRSFQSGKYTQGYSDHLPVYMLIEKQ